MDRPLHDLILRETRRRVRSLHGVASTRDIGIGRVMILDEAETEGSASVLVAGEFG